MTEDYGFNVSEIHLREGGYYRKVQAYKSHQCGKCGRGINPGRIYWRLYGVRGRWVRELCGICLDVYVLN